jgi:hypothetical protein
MVSWLCTDIVECLLPDAARERHRVHDLRRVLRDSLPGGQ